MDYAGKTDACGARDCSCMLEWLRADDRWPTQSEMVRLQRLRHYHSRDGEGTGLVVSPAMAWTTTYECPESPSSNRKLDEDRMDLAQSELTAIRKLMVLQAQILVALAQTRAIPDSFISEARKEIAAINTRADAIASVLAKT